MKHHGRSTSRYLYLAISDHYYYNYWMWSSLDGFEGKYSTQIVFIENNLGGGVK